MGDAEKISNRLAGCLFFTRCYSRLKGAVVSDEVTVPLFVPNEIAEIVAVIMRLNFPLVICDIGRWMPQRKLPRGELYCFALKVDRAGFEKMRAELVERCTGMVGCELLESFVEVGGPDIGRAFLFPQLWGGKVSVH
jgi:hypothetical protein